MQYSEQLGKRWVRKGDVVYQLNPDGSLGAELTYQDFTTNPAYKGLNLDIMPQYQEQKEERQYDTGNEQLNALIDRMGKMLEDTMASGNQINPNIELDPSVVSGFLEQAQKEVEPYYGSQIKLMKDDLQKNLEYLGKQYEINKQDSEARFKQSLEADREGHAGRGTIFSGARQRGEADMVAAQNRSLESNALAAQNTAQSNYSQTERTIGSRNLAGLTSPQLSAYSASNEGMGSFSPSRSLSFGGTENVTGSLEREQTTAVLGRRNELESAERSRRALNFYNQ